MISGITHLRKQIELQEESAQRGYTGYAVVSRHDFINAIRTCQEDIAKILGEEEAAKTIDDFLHPLTHGG